MIVLGLLLLIAVAVVVAFVVVAGVGQQTRLTSDLLNLDWRPSVLLVFLLGALCLLGIVLALALIRGGTRRRVEQRRELKRLRSVERDRGHQPSGGPHGRPTSSSPQKGDRAVDLGHDDGRATRSATGPDTERPVSPGDPAVEPTSGTSGGGWHDDPGSSRGPTRAV